MNAPRSRLELLADLRRVGREHSDATVLFHASIATALGLHPTDYKALGVLDRVGPMGAGDLARHTGLAAASVTNLVDRLEAKGFVQREADPSDRRRVLLRAVIDEPAAADAFASTNASLAQLWDRYSYGELAIIADFLAANTERLRAETEAVSRAGAAASAPGESHRSDSRPAARRGRPEARPPR
jgi:DNA-binding MarR family transcriptional regulator